jgi:hypothetical protein
MFVSQLPSNICTFPFRCLSENLENQSRIKISVTCTRSCETEVLFSVSCCLRRRLPRSLHRRDVGVRFLASRGLLLLKAVVLLCHFISAVCVNSFGLWLRSPVAKCDDSASTLRQRDCFVKGVALNLFSLRSTSPAEIGDDSTSSHNKRNLFEPLQFMVDISRL